MYIRLGYYSVVFFYLFFSCSRKEETLNEFDNCSTAIDTTGLKNNALNKMVLLRNENLWCLIEKVKNDTFSNKYVVDSIHGFIFYFLQRQVSDKFILANPGEPWQAGCTPPIEFDSCKILTEKNPNTGEIETIIPILNKVYPRRQLYQFSMGKTTAILTYRSGGFASMNHLLIFEIKNNKIVDFWCFNPDSKEILKGNIAQKLERSYTELREIERNEINL